MAGGSGGHASFEIGGEMVAPGQTRTVHVPVANLYTQAPVTLPVRVVRGRHPGPVIFISAALHGDEIIGVEIIRRLLRLPELRDPENLRGTVLAVPVVNMLAFLNQSRYLPDRRDLNRSFPGSETGSLAARLAHLFIREVVGKSDYGIDLHTGAIHRPNLPQVRADFGNADALRLARAFGVPLLLNSTPTGGTLREYTTSKNIPVLLYESSEALRFDEVCIRIGVQGILNVLSELGVASPQGVQPLAMAEPEPVVARSSTWVRSPASGILRTQVALGAQVRNGQPLGMIGDPFGDIEIPVLSSSEGVIVGRLDLPLVHEGDALFHVGRFDAPEAAALAVQRLRAASRIWEVEETPIV
ncbi:MAG TPA: succinylglutamate desuccinylase/aspartoacylase family protein [Stenotrophobium sp.]|nr:succinylglutamate desuccinylase/aspartoacylase family protein [Stenotrophobium sp.]